MQQIYTLKPLYKIHNVEISAKTQVPLRTFVAMSLFRQLLPLLYVVLIISTIACDPVERVSTKGTLADKDSAAVKYFNKKRYDEAAYIIEQLLGIYKGTPREQQMLYYYAWSKYHMGELTSASYYFGDYARRYPTSKDAEEFAFMEAFCQYLVSDPYYLDQTYTMKSIEALQVFVNNHPLSVRINKCNELMSELRERLAEKMFKQADLYLKMEKYKAAVSYFKQFIQEFPDSKFREEAQFKLVKAAYLFAKFSVEEKKQERIAEAMSYYEKFAGKYSGGKFAHQSETLYEDILHLKDSMSGKNKHKTIQ